jgi:uncharacterized protein (DUF952 family)
LNPVTPEKLIYHIALESDWQKALEKGEYRADSLETEGFIHSSTASQVERTANRFYNGDIGLVLLEIEVEKLPVEVKYEEALEGEWFPHIYGPLFLDAVRQVMPFEAGVDGLFHWPG